VPIFLENEKRLMYVEIQLRTNAMDFWASLEHKLRYKKDIPGTVLFRQSQMPSKMITVLSKIAWISHA
jgi:ppGpp synthetase/RelA/SpoT-type nucleotidyltranferase